MVIPLTDTLLNAIAFERRIVAQALRERNIRSVDLSGSDTRWFMTFHNPLTGLTQEQESEFDWSLDKGPCLVFDKDSRFAIALELEKCRGKVRD